MLFFPHQVCKQTPNNNCVSVVLGAVVHLADSRRCRPTHKLDCERQPRATQETVMVSEAESSPTHSPESWPAPARSTLHPNESLIKEEPGVFGRRVTSSYWHCVFCLAPPIAIHLCMSSSLFRGTVCEILTSSGQKIVPVNWSCLHTKSRKPRPLSSSLFFFLKAQAFTLKIKTCCQAVGLSTTTQLSGNKIFALCILGSIRIVL